MVSWSEYSRAAGLFQRPVDDGRQPNHDEEVPDQRRADRAVWRRADDYRTAGTRHIRPDSRRRARLGPRSHCLSTPRLARFRPKAAARVGPRPGELTVFGTCVAISSLAGLSSLKAATCNVSKALFLRREQRD